MKENVTRRNFLATAGIAAMAATTVCTFAGEWGGGKSLKTLGVSCSPRKGRTTAQAVRAALDAAQAVDPPHPNRAD